MISSIKFSIIIPVYKNQDTIKNTLSSVFCQKYSNFEVIISNDGSGIDYSYLTELYKDIVIFNNEVNEGPGMARQHAVDNAVSGDWVIFLDADDQLPSDNVLSMLSRYIHIHNKKINVIEGNYVLYRKTDSELYKNVFGPMHAKCFRVSFLKENNIRFHRDVPYFEDMYFNMLYKFIDKNKYDGKSILKIDKVIYNQYERDNSITSSFNDEGNNYFNAKFISLQNIILRIYEDNNLHLNDFDKKMLCINGLMITCNFIFAYSNPSIDDIFVLSDSQIESIRNGIRFIENLYKYDDISSIDDIYELYMYTFSINEITPFYKNMIVVLYSFAYKEPNKFKSFLNKCVEYIK